MLRHLTSTHSPGGAIRVGQDHPELDLTPWSYRAELGCTTPLLPETAPPSLLLVPSGNTSCTQILGSRSACVEPTLRLERGQVMLPQ